MKLAELLEKVEFGFTPPENPVVLSLHLDGQDAEAPTVVGKFLVVKILDRQSAVAAIELYGHALCHGIHATCFRLQETISCHDSEGDECPCLGSFGPELGRNTATPAQHGWHQVLQAILHLELGIPALDVLPQLTHALLM